MATGVVAAEAVEVAAEVDDAKLKRFNSIAGKRFSTMFDIIVLEEWHWEDSDIELWQRHRPNSHARYDFIFY